MQIPSLNKLKFLLGTLLAIPVLFVAVNTLISTQEDKELLGDIYSRQMQNLHYSINQQLKEIVINYFETYERVSLLRSDGLLKAKLNWDESFSKNQKDLTRFKEQILLGLTNESVATKNGSSIQLVSKDSLLYALKRNDKEALVFKKEIFIRTEIVPLLELNSNENIRIELLGPDDKRPLFSKGTINSNQVFSEQPLLFWSEMTLRLQLTDESIEGIQSQRRTRTYAVIGISILFSVVVFIAFFSIYQKEKQLSSLKTDFVANVSHELKTPLSLIRMNAESLQLGRVKSEEKVKHYLSVIISESERLSHLIQNILNFSKLESGKKTYQFTAVDLNAMINQVMEQYAILFHQKGFEVKLELAETNPNIYADTNDLTEILLNLLDNAVKYSKEKKLIEIKTAESDSLVTLSLKDSGIGISKNDLNQIMQPFYRVENSLTQQTKGTGLGLSLVKQLMEACEGKISFKSEMNKGTIVQLEFKKLNPTTTGN